MALTDAEMVRRIRAARAYADLNQKELGDLIELSAETIKRIEAGTRKPKTSEVNAIADKTKMPRSFFIVEMEDLEIPGLQEVEEAARALEIAELKPGNQRKAAEKLSVAATSLQKAAERLLESDLENASGQSAPSAPDSEE